MLVWNEQTSYAAFNWFEWVPACVEHSLWAAILIIQSAKLSITSGKCLKICQLVKRYICLIIQTFSFQTLITTFHVKHKSMIDCNVLFPVVGRCVTFQRLHRLDLQSWDLHDIFTSDSVRLAFLIISASDSSECFKTHDKSTMLCRRRIGSGSLVQQRDEFESLKAWLTRLWRDHLMTMAQAMYLSAFHEPGEGGIGGLTRMAFSYATDYDELGWYFPWSVMITICERISGFNERFTIRVSEHCGLEVEGIWRICFADDFMYSADADVSWLPRATFDQLGETVGILRERASLACALNVKTRRCDGCHGLQKMPFPIIWSGVNEQGEFMSFPARVLRFNEHRCLHLILAGEH